MSIHLAVFLICYGIKPKPTKWERSKRSMQQNQQQQKITFGIMEDENQNINGYQFFWEISWKLLKILLLKVFKIWWHFFLFTISQILSYLELRIIVVHNQLLNFLNALVYRANSATNRGEYAFFIHFILKKQNIFRCFLPRQQPICLY